MEIMCEFYQDLFFITFFLKGGTNVENANGGRAPGSSVFWKNQNLYFKVLEKFKTKFHGNLIDFRTNVYGNYLNLLWFVGCTKKTKIRPNKKKYWPILEIRFCLFSVRHVWKYLVLNFCTDAIHMCESVYKQFQKNSPCGNFYFENELRGARPLKALTRYQCHYIILF